MLLFLFWSNASAPLQHAEKSWDKEQRRNHREKQSTYDRPAKGSILFVAKLTTRILFEVATPMHMMAPMSAGTLRVVWVMNKNQAIPASAAGSAEIMMKGSSQD